MIKMMSFLFLIFVMLSGCAKDTVTTGREVYYSKDIYIETRHSGGRILKDMKPLPNEMKTHIVEQMTFSEIEALLGPCHEFYNADIERKMWYFDDHTLLLFSSLKEEDGWYRWELKFSFETMSENRDKGLKIEDYEIRDEDIDTSRTS